MRSQLHVNQASVLSYLLAVMHSQLAMNMLSDYKIGSCIG